MRRIVLWGMIAVLGIPVITTAQEQPVSPNAPNPAVPPRAPAAGPNFQYAPPGIEFAPRAGIEYRAAFQTTDANSKYWIGLSCAPVDEALRSQLGIEAGGLAVRHIADDSPAKEAGLAVHDVITEIRVGDESHKPADIAQLTALVQQAEKKPMGFVVLRRGKSVNLMLTPRERNVANPRHTPIWNPQSGEANPMFFRMTGPVVAFPGPRPGAANLPDDVTVVITKSGNEPVRIAVQQKGRGEWRLREKEGAIQPEHVSQAVMSVMGYLSRLTGRVEVKDGNQVFHLEPGSQPNFGIGPWGAPQQYGVPVTGAVVPPNPPVAVPARQPPSAPSPPSPSSLQQQLDDIQKQQEQVTKALDELRQSLQKSQPRN